MSLHGSLRYKHNSYMTASFQEAGSKIFQAIKGLSQEWQYGQSVISAVFPGKGCPKTYPNSRRRNRAYFLVEGDIVHEHRMRMMLLLCRRPYGGAVKIGRVIAVLVHLMGTWGSEMLWDNQGNIIELSPSETTWIIIAVIFLSPWLSACLYLHLHLLCPWPLLLLWASVSSSAEWDGHLSIQLKWRLHEYNTSNAWYIWVSNSPIPPGHCYY